jgi:hypothetical protein
LKQSDGATRLDRLNPAMHFMQALKIHQGWTKFFIQSFEVLIGAASKFSLSHGLFAFRDEPVKYIARIKVVSDDRPAGLMPVGMVPWNRPVPCTWSIEHGDGAVRGAPETFRWCGDPSN